MTKRSESAAQGDAEETFAELTPAQVVVRRIRAIRTAQGLSMRALAELVQERTGYRLVPDQLWSIESGRYQLKVDQMFAIAAGLGVSPLALQTMPTDDPVEVRVAPEAIVPAVRFNGWLTGTAPLPGGDKSTFAEFHPYGAPIGRFRGDFDQRLRAHAHRTAGNGKDAEANAEAWREETLAFVAILAELPPTPDVVSTARALSRRLGIDIPLRDDETPTAEAAIVPEEPEP